MKGREAITRGADFPVCPPQALSLRHLWGKRSVCLRRQDCLRHRRTPQAVAFGCVLLAVASLSGCTREGKFQAISMWNESRLKPYEPVNMPGMDSSALPLPANTVARGQVWGGDPLVTGMQNGKPVTQYPIPISHQVLERGQERFNAYCAPCHGRLGNGEGMVVKRSFPHPPDYAIKRLRDAPVGHFFDVMTHGYGIMYPYSDRVPVKDRWAIAAYIRVLQASRPEVPEDRYQTERERARATGIGTRPVRE